MSLRYIGLMTNSFLTQFSVFVFYWPPAISRAPAARFVRLYTEYLILLRVEKVIWEWRTGPPHETRRPSGQKDTTTDVS